jgi:hypothetical protein
MPRDDRDLFIAASNSHILAFDNVSSVAPWISDTLCRLATGGGFATRTLHTDDDETLFNATRPIILNGIEDMVKRSDLASRSIFITLEPMPECERRAEREFYDEFNKDCPKIFGTLLTALAGGLGCLPKTKLTYLPRMADFALWASACEHTLWNAGSFQAAYFANIGKATEHVIEADIIGCAVRDFMAGRHEWEGTAAALLGELTEAAPDRTTKSKDWPVDSTRMAGRLRRVAEPLRKIGLSIHFPTNHHTKIFTISHALEIIGKSASPASPPPQHNNINELAGTLRGRWHATGTLDGDAGTLDGTLENPSVPCNLLKNKEIGAGDAGDAKNPIISRGDKWEGEI